jgi:hypothetical protein
LLVTWLEWGRLFQAESQCCVLKEQCREGTCGPQTQGVREGPPPSVWQMQRVNEWCGRLGPNLNAQLKMFPARHWWLTPVILATQEAEIRRIMVQSNPRQIVQETLSWKKKNPSRKRDGGVAQSVGLEFKPQYWKKKKKLGKAIPGNEKLSLTRMAS